MIVDASETCQNTPKYKMKSALITLKIVLFLLFRLFDSFFSRKKCFFVT